MWSLASKEWLRYLFSSGVVSFRNDFCDHGDRILSRQQRRTTTEEQRNREDEEERELRTENLVLSTGNCSYTGTGTLSIISFNT